MGLLRRYQKWKMLRPTSPPPQPQRWIQYGCMRNGEITFIYSTDASMGNDPIYGRSDGASSRGRLMEGTGRNARPISDWRPVYNGDLATHRYSPSED
jgi:hypothetical protein